MPIVAAPDAPASAAADVGEAPSSAGEPPFGARPPLLAAGDEPPPLYRTQLPPSVTLHYQVRRGFLRGTGRSAGGRAAIAIASPSKRRSRGSRS